MNHFEGARSSILMPYIFVGFDICHQSHSRRYLALLLWFYGENAYKKPCHLAVSYKMARGFMDVGNRWLF